MFRLRHYETDALKTYTQEFPPALVARNQLENAVAEFSTFETARVREGLNNAIQAALTNTKSPADALAEAQASQLCACFATTNSLNGAQGTGRFL